jgi:hypothetical protein
MNWVQKTCSEELSQASQALKEVRDEMLQSAMQSTGNGGVVEMDDTTHRMLLRIARAPSQVLRYAKEQTPLWTSNTKIPEAKDITPCERCGCKRQFEFQIMPQLISFLGIDKLTWVGSQVLDAFFVKKQDKPLLFSTALFFLSGTRKKPSRFWYNCYLYL